MLIDAQGLLVVIIVGVVAGWVGAVSDRASAIGHLIAGVIGAYLGIYLSTTLSIRVPVSDPWMAQVVVAAIGAGFVIVLLLPVVASAAVGLAVGSWGLLSTVPSATTPGLRGVLGQGGRARDVGTSKIAPRCSGGP
jgi:uncharacterized membrane protein YeaQ/YmgE (transglycosylase-associated protein family)